jgi:hypothetical protein
MAFVRTLTTDWKSINILNGLVDTLHIDSHNLDTELLRVRERIKFYCTAESNLIDLLTEDVKREAKVCLTSKLKTVLYRTTLLYQPKDVQSDFPHVFMVICKSTGDTPVNPRAGGPQVGEHTPILSGVHPHHKRGLWGCPPPKRGLWGCPPPKRGLWGCPPLTGAMGVSPSPPETLINYCAHTRIVSSIMAFVRTLTTDWKSINILNGLVDTLHIDSHNLDTELLRVRERFKFYCTVESNLIDLLTEDVKREANVCLTSKLKNVLYRTILLYQPKDVQFDFPHVFMVICKSTGDTPVNPRAGGPQVGEHTPILSGVHPH